MHRHPSTPALRTGAGLLLLVLSTTLASPAHSAAPTTPAPVAPAPAPAPIAADDTTPAATAPQTIETLMARLAAMPGLYARFKETKTIGLLAMPLINTGTVQYHPPGRLLRTIESPHPSQVLLVEDDVWMVEGTAHEHIDLGAHPAARSFVGSFRSLLAGDRAALAKHFELKLESEAEAWALELRPRTAAMRQIVTLMRVSGHAEVVQRMVIEEASGDVSDTRFWDVDTKRNYSKADVARLFGPPA